MITNYSSNLVGNISNKSSPKKSSPLQRISTYIAETIYHNKGSNNNSPSEKSIKSSVKKGSAQKEEIPLINEDEIFQTFDQNEEPENETKISSQAQDTHNENTITLQKRKEYKLKIEQRDLIKEHLERVNCYTEEDNVRDTKKFIHRKSNSYYIREQSNNNSDNFYIDHQSLYLKLFNCVIVLFSLFRVIWQSSYISFSSLSNLPQGLTILVDLLFYVDIVINFYKTQKDVNMTKVYEIKKIRSRQLYNEFVYDFFAIIPIDQIALMTNNSNRLLTIYKVISVRKILLISSPNSIKNQKTKIISDLMLLFGQVALQFHMMICVWNIVQFETFSGEDLEGTEKLPHNVWFGSETTSHQQITSAYALQLTLLGNDVVPSQTGSMAICLIFGVIGLVGISVMIGEFTVKMSQISEQKAMFLKERDQLNSYLEAMSMPLDQKQKIIKAHECIHCAKTDWSNAIVNQFNTKYKKRILLWQHKQILDSSGLACSLSSDECFALVKQLQAQQYLPHDVIVEKGEQGHEMFFLSLGKARVILGQNDDSLKIHHPSFFGEIALVRGTRRLATVIACSFCRLEVLTKVDFDDLSVRHRFFKQKFLRGLSQTRLYPQDTINALRKYPPLSQASVQQIERCISLIEEDSQEPNEHLLVLNDRPNVLLIVFQGKLKLQALEDACDYKGDDPVAEISQYTGSIVTQNLSNQDIVGNLLDDPLKTKIIVRVVEPSHVGILRVDDVYNSLQFASKRIGISGSQIKSLSYNQDRYIDYLSYGFSVSDKHYNNKNIAMKEEIIKQIKMEFDESSDTDNICQNLDHLTEKVEKIQIQFHSSFKSLENKTVEMQNQIEDKFMKLEILLQKINYK